MPKTLLLEKISYEEMIDHMKDLNQFLLKKLKKIDRNPKIFLQKDKKNADDFFGKTGFYDPDKEEIHLFTTDRHPKDILRSFAHEMVHHEQNCSGYTATVDMSKTHEADYASKDPKLREAERDAFERGNMIFRDWTDKIKAKRQKRKNKMKISENTLRRIIAEKVKCMEEGSNCSEKKQSGYYELEEGEKSDRARNPMAYKPSGGSAKEHPVKGKKGQTWGDVVGHESEKGEKKKESMQKMMDETPEEYLARRDAAIKKAIADREGKGKDKKGKKSDEAVKEAEMLARKHAKKAMEQRSGHDLKKLKKEYEYKEKLSESTQIGGIVELKPITDIQHPYPHLFDKKERALKDAFEQKDERIYNELMKRFGLGKQDGDK